MPLVFYSHYDLCPHKRKSIFFRNQRLYEYYLRSIWRLWHIIFLNTVFAYVRTYVLRTDKVYLRSKMEIIVNFFGGLYCEALTTTAAIFKNDNTHREILKQPRLAAVGSHVVFIFL